MGRTFLDLPPEVQSSVVSWVLRPHDIAQLCLVSQQLFDVTMPFLYHSMYLNVDRWKREDLDRFLTHGHKGHQFVRSLDIDSDDLGPEKLARKLAKDVLQILPRNCLSSFRCPLETGIDDDLMIMLSSTQTKLAFLSLGPLMQNALNIPQCLQPWPPTLKTVVIPWQINVVMDTIFYQRLIQRSAKSLNALTVRSESFTMHDNFPIVNPGKANSSEFLVRSLFSHILDGARHPMLEISDLNLQNQDLKTAGDTWLRAIDFTKLRTLQLWNCSNADSILAHLIKLAKEHPMRLHGLVLSFEDPNQAPSLALDFIGSFTGLKYLNLCYCPQVVESWEPSCGDLKSVYMLAGHQHSIKDLYIGIGANVMHHQNLHVPSFSDLELFCGECKNLRQLAIAMPRLYISHALTGEWDSFGLHLRVLATLPRLKTLRILTWPVIHDPEYLSLETSRSTRARKKKIYLKYLDIIATSIARDISYTRREVFGEERHRLSVIIFGSAEQSDAIDKTDGSQEYHSVGPISYKVRRKHTEFGVITKAKRIDSYLMEYEEPVAYVVDEDTDQGLSLEAYSWG